MASYRGVDPRIDDGIIERILELLIQETGTTREDLVETAGVRRLRASLENLGPEWFKKACKTIDIERDAKNKIKTLGERFVQIKMRLCDAIGARMIPHWWLPEDVMVSNKFDFALASHAFDRTLYKSGRKRTQKDEDLAFHCFESNGLRESQEIDILKRHNMISYNFVKRELTMKNAPHLFTMAQPDFFFPLPKTEKVLHRLVKMWNVMAAYCKFPPSYLTVEPLPDEPDFILQPPRLLRRAAFNIYVATKYDAVETWTKRRALCESPLGIYEPPERTMTCEELRRKRDDEVMEELLLEINTPANPSNQVSWIVCTVDA